MEMENKEFDLEELEQDKAEQLKIHSKLVAQNAELREKIRRATAKNEELRKRKEETLQSIDVIEKKKEALGLDELKAQLADMTECENELKAKESFEQEELKRVVAECTNGLISQGGAMDQLHYEFKSPDCLRNGAKTLACKVEEVKKLIEKMEEQFEKMEGKVAELCKVELIEEDSIHIIKDDAKAKLEKDKRVLQKIEDEIAQAKASYQNQGHSRPTPSQYSRGGIRGPFRPSASGFGASSTGFSKFWSQRPTQPK